MKEAHVDFSKVEAPIGFLCAHARLFVLCPPPSSVLSFYTDKNTTG